MARDSGMDFPPGEPPDWGKVLPYCRKHYARKFGRPSDDPDVEDLAAETTVRAYSKVSRDPLWSYGVRFMMLLHGIMKNVLKERARAAARSRRLFAKLCLQRERFITSPIPHPLDAKEIYDLIRGPVAGRSDAATMQAFDLQQFEGTPAKEVADLLGMTMQAVYSAKHNVQARIIEEEGFLHLERLLKELEAGDTKAAIRRVITEVRDECPEKMRPVIDALYGSDVVKRPDQVDADLSDLYKPRAAFLKRLRPVLLKLIHQEEG